MPPETSELLARVRSGDEPAMRSLLVEHMSSLVAYVRLQAGPGVVAKEPISDLVQSVCLEALRNLDSFEYRGEAPFRHWLCKQALRKIQQKARHHRAEKRDVRREVAQQALDDAGGLAECYRTICTPSQHASAREAMRAFEAAFQDLPEDYREAITLRRIVGLSYADIAAQMGRSEGAVTNLVYRGIARLAMRLD